MNTSYIVRMRRILFAAIAVSGFFILAAAARAQTPIFTPIHSFTGKPDGNQPFAGRLVQGFDGDFYGTTFNGGTNNAGCIYEFPPNGGVNVLYSFSGGADGGYPEAGLVLGSNGYFYGVTTYGGVTTDGSAYGNGVVFKMDQFGSPSLLYTFTNGIDGYGPQAALVQGTNGNFYGTTANGGATTNGYGTIFMITPGGTFSPLYAFKGGDDGSTPNAPLIEAQDGNFYGTTAYGGTNDAGTVFQITPSGGFKSLYSFTNGVDGRFPWLAALTQGNDGAFYGTTFYGGTNTFGSIFRITSTGHLTPVYSFADGLDGDNPVGGLEQGTNGEFYGVTESGGSGTNGIIFSVTAGGGFSVLYSFTNGVDGAGPVAGLAQGPDGILYGTAAYGGANQDGTVFSLDFPPANDDFANAIVISGTDYFTNTSNIGATLEPGEASLVPYSVGASVWWTWTPTLNGTLNVNVNSTSISTWVVVYVGDDLSDLDPISINNGYASFTITPYTQYYIAVYGQDGEEGNFSFQLSEDVCYPPEPNPPTFTTSQTNESDGLHVIFCADVQGTGLGVPSWSPVSPPNPIAAFVDANSCFEVVVPETNEEPVSVSMTVGGQCGTSGGTSPGVPTCGICLSRGAPFVQGGAAGGDGAGFTTDTLDCGTVSTNALWYRMIASDDGPITVSTEGSETETLLGVYTGAWGSQSNIACYNGIASSSSESRLTFNAVQGTAYWIAVDPQGNVAAPLRVAAGFQPNIQSYGLMPDGSFALKSSAGPPITYTLLSTATLSTNPSDWTVVLTTNLTTRAPYINYRDTNVQGASQRFYELGPIQ